MTTEQKDEGSCEEREDETHCRCWWDGDVCCDCGHDGPIAESEERP